MHSIFQFFHNTSSPQVKSIYCFVQLSQWVCLEFNHRGLEQHKAKLSLLSPEGKVETNFKVFKGIFQEGRLINKKSQSRS